MSTRNSLGLYRKERTVVESVHIYTDMLDDEEIYYFQTETATLVIPKEVAEVFGNAMKVFEDNNK